jgi:hypothetical protein
VRNDLKLPHYLTFLPGSKIGTGSVWFFPQISQTSAGNISAKISAISGKQILWASSKLKLGQYPKI